MNASDALDADTIARRHANDPRWRTLDHHIISDGLRVWNYDLQPGTVWVDPARVDSPHWDGWFDVITDNGGGKIMNGQRLWVMHPIDGVAPPAFADPRCADLLAAQKSGAKLVATASGQTLPVVHDPRVPTDSRPWRNDHHQRFTSTEVDTATEEPTSRVASNTRYGRTPR